MKGKLHGSMGREIAWEHGKENCTGAREIVLGITSNDAATFGLGAIQVVANAVTTWVIDRAGHRLLLIISSAGMTLSLFIFAVAFVLKVSSVDGRVLRFGELKGEGAMIKQVKGFSYSVAALLGIGSLITSHDGSRGWQRRGQWTRN
ncbi:sugar transporter ERD6-like 6 [Cucumis melo var. makuwa]|uniref:Sugar transporter ERD6-like 6 n=1 Tax=Cucumis melo var. makuwa TaxID=1194695 RepID=A0A5D3DC73_CUCMM|nr:sugar transporter ERD6-like 6 [Cucumis melo var. makuwa]TYK21184.1 sugar transporter ERD6-like 6 [Cucumis melo var. makuwa]